MCSCSTSVIRTFLRCYDEVIQRMNNLFIDVVEHNSELAGHLLANHRPMPKVTKHALKYIFRGEHLVATSVNVSQADIVG